MTVEIIPERAENAALIDPLLDRTFGPERKAKTVYRLRHGLAPIAALSFIAIDGQGQGLASLRFWSIRIEAQRDEVTAAILLGPLAVEPDLQGQGLGRALLSRGLEAAVALGHGICVVVGERAYYEPYGFANAGKAGLVLPGPVDPRRFQVKALVANALDGVRGLIARDESATVNARRCLRRNAAA